MGPSVVEAEASRCCVNCHWTVHHVMYRLSGWGWSSWSVFSEAFECARANCLDLTALKEVYLRVRPQGGRAPFIVMIMPIYSGRFLGSHVYQPKIDLTLWSGRFFARAPARAVSIHFTILLRYNGTNRFSFKRAFDWLSYRILVKIWILLWKSGCGGGIRAAGHFLTSFLNESIEQK